MDPKICSKRREYLDISQFYNNVNSDSSNEGSLKTNQRIYCGNWSKTTDQKYQQNITNNLFKKSVHYVGKVENSTSKSYSFRILYVVRSAMPPVINDGKRLEQQNGFKVKVRLVKMR